MRACEARLELDRLADGRKRFKGELAGVEGDKVAINLEEEEAETALIPFAWIIEAKLILNDDLMKRGAESARPACNPNKTSETRSRRHGPHRHFRQPAGTAADRRGGRPREVDRKGDRHRGHRGGDAEGRPLALRRRARHPRPHRPEDRRDHHHPRGHRGSRRPGDREHLRLQVPGRRRSSTTRTPLSARPTPRSCRPSSSAGCRPRWPARW